MIDLSERTDPEIRKSIQRTLKKTSLSFPQRLMKDLPEKIGKDVSDLRSENGVVMMSVERSSILKLCTLLKDGYGFDHLSLISAVDWRDRFELVYHLFSYPNNCMVEVKVVIPRDDPSVDSVTPLWGGANWHEREAYDMMGIVFENHPDLRRILLPEDYEYFPLRKDFEMELE